MTTQTTGRDEILQIIEDASGPAMDHITENAPGYIERNALERCWHTQRQTLAQRPGGDRAPAPETPVTQAIRQCYIAALTTAGLYGPGTDDQGMAAGDNVPLDKPWYHTVQRAWSHTMASLAAKAHSQARLGFEAGEDDAAVQLALRAARTTVSYLASMPGYGYGYGYAHGTDQDLANIAAALRTQPGNNGPTATQTLVPMERLLRAATHESNQSNQGREKTRIAARMLCANTPGR